MFVDGSIKNIESKSSEEPSHYKSRETDLNASFEKNNETCPEEDFEDVERETNNVSSALI